MVQWVFSYKIYKEIRCIFREISFNVDKTWHPKTAAIHKQQRLSHMLVVMESVAAE